MNKKNNRKGFTIVELVIVIAVIAILATVLAPVFGDLINNANDSKLLQELRNEYTTYTMKVGADVEDTIVILWTDGNYYEVTSGKPNTTPLTGAAIPAEGDFYWNASSDAMVEVTVPATT